MEEREQESVANVVRVLIEASAGCRGSPDEGPLPLSGEVRGGYQRAHLGRLPSLCSWPLSPPGSSWAMAFAVVPLLASPTPVPWSWLLVSFVWIATLVSYLGFLPPFSCPLKASYVLSVTVANILWLISITSEMKSVFYVWHLWVCPSL